MLDVFSTIQVDEMAKISAVDKLFCEEQQHSLYTTLDQLDKWYSFFKREAEQYDEYISYEVNGSVKMKYYSGLEKVQISIYSSLEFKPFDNINNIVKERCRAIDRFYRTITNHFNTTYSLTVDSTDFDTEKTPVTFRPLFSHCVNRIINHLGGCSFRETAEAELINRFLKVAMPGYGKEPDLKGEKIIFHNILSFDDFYIASRGQYSRHYNCRNELGAICEGLALAGCNALNGDEDIIINFNGSNINIAEPYDLNTDEPKQMKFYKNGRIDVKFSSKAKAESAYNRLKLNVPYTKSA